MFRGSLSHNEPACGPVTAAHARGGGRRRGHPQRPASLLPPPAAFSGARPGDAGAAGTPSAALPPAEAAAHERLGLSLPAPCPGRGRAPSTFSQAPVGQAGPQLATRGNRTLPPLPMPAAPRLILGTPLIPCQEFPFQSLLLENQPNTRRPQVGLQT